MSKAESKKYLEISQEDLLKIQRSKSLKEKKAKVNDVWLYIAEFGYYFGWEGVMAIRNNEIPLEEADLLLLGARKVWSGKLYDHMSASFIGTVSANSRKPVKTFKSATREIIKETKADK